MVTRLSPRLIHVPGLMVRATSLPPPWGATMTEPSQVPGCRPHLSILTDLICPSYSWVFVWVGCPAMASGTRLSESAAPSRRTTTVLIRFIGAPPSRNSPPPCAPPRLGRDLRQTPCHALPGPELAQ